MTLVEQQHSLKVLRQNIKNMTLQGTESVPGRVEATNHRVTPSCLFRETMKTGEKCWRKHTGKTGCLILALNHPV